MRHIMHVWLKMKIVLHSTLHFIWDDCRGSHSPQPASFLKVVINCVKHHSSSCKLPQLSLEPEKVMQVF